MRARADGNQNQGLPGRAPAWCCRKWAEEVPAGVIDPRSRHPDCGKRPWRSRSRICRASRRPVFVLRTTMARILAASRLKATDLASYLASDQLLCSPGGRRLYTSPQTY